MYVHTYHPGVLFLLFVIPKVRGFCVDKSNLEVFDEVDVYGNIYDAIIHHMRFGVYTYGEN